MNIEILILRLLHIGTGVFWAGSLIYLAAFISPAVNAMGQEGGKFMQQLSRTNKLPVWMTAISFLNILTGVRLLWINIERGGTAWLTGHEGASFALGGLLGLGAFMIGMMVNRPAVSRMAEIGEAVAKAGGPPTPEQAQQLAFLRAKMQKGIRLVAWHLGATVVLMSAARMM